MSAAEYDYHPNPNPAFDYNLVFDFEKGFDRSYVESCRMWMVNNWHLSILYAVLYVIIIFGGSAYMKSRPRFELRPALIVWNLILAVFSILGAVRTLPEFIYVLYNYGIHYSACNNSFFYGVSGFWAWMFTMSKAFELGDTMFIALRKQQLIFLHWYHHITVMIYCWYNFVELPPTARWFVTINYVVHSLMYSYYAARAMKIRVPRFVNIVITTIQLVQMVIGSVLTLWVYNHKNSGGSCRLSDTNIRLSFMMYFSYFVLFAHFFYTTYLSPKPSSLKEE